MIPPDIPNVGDLCIVVWRFCVNRINDMGETEVYTLCRDDAFIMIDWTEIKENNVLEFQILFENMKMWFNIHISEHTIDNVRSVETYDIPFIMLQEAELGSNNSSS